MREGVEARVLVFKGSLVGLLYGFYFMDSKFEVTQINLRRKEEENHRAPLKRKKRATQSVSWREETSSLDPNSPSVFGSPPSLLP